MEHAATILITIGSLFLIGLVTDAVGARTKLPRVTLLIIFGVVIGPSLLNLVPYPVTNWFPIVGNMALAMIGFLLGGKLKFTTLRYTGHQVLWISIAEVVVTALIVGGGLLLLGVRPEIALLLAGISAATAPAATADVIWEAKARGKFTQTLLGIVAIDDAWALIIFSLLFVIAQMFVGKAGGMQILTHSAWELGGAVLLGVVFGYPMAFLTGRIKSGEPTIVEALGLVFLCCGLALWLKVSYLLAVMVLGLVVTNLAHHHKRPFHAIEGIERPFMVLFFILAGVSLHLGLLMTSGLIGIAYVILRFIGRIIGGYSGGVIAHSDKNTKRWIGLALMPQAGVALGMALVASENFPEVKNIILPVVLGATVAFEIIGPIMTRMALMRAHEIPAKRKATQKTS